MKLILVIFLQVTLGFLYASLIEYYSHMIALHKWGVHKDSFFAHHWHGHHRNARKFEFLDSTYVNGFLSWNKHGREYFSVLAMLILNAVLFGYLFPYFTLTGTIYGLAYLYAHRKMHLNPGWGRRYFPHHYSHHMHGKQQHAWGVLTCFWDRILGTRYPK